MEDSKIIELFYERSEQAIVEVSKKYGRVFHSVSQNILNNKRDVEECVNDAYLGAWNTIPPQTPNPLVTYICRIVRNVSIKKYHSNTAVRRNSYYDLVLDELEECIASPTTVESEYTSRQLAQSIDQFLDTLEQENRVIFVRRYWFSDSVSDISKQLGVSCNVVSVKLSRMRKKLRKYLEKEGVCL